MQKYASILHVDMSIIAAFKSYRLSGMVLKRRPAIDGVLLKNAGSMTKEYSGGTTLQKHI